MAMERRQAGRDEAAEGWMAGGAWRAEHGERSNEEADAACRAGGKRRPHGVRRRRAQNEATRTQQRRGDVIEQEGRAPKMSAVRCRFDARRRSRHISHAHAVLWRVDQLRRRKGRTASRSSSNQTNPKPGGFLATQASLTVPYSRKKSRRSLPSASGGRFPMKTYQIQNIVRGT